MPFKTQKLPDKTSKRLSECMGRNTYRVSRPISKLRFEKQKIEISSTTRIQEARLDAQREVVARNATGEVRLQETEASIALNSRHAGYAFFRRKLQQAQEVNHFNLLMGLSHFLHVVDTCGPQ